MFFWIDKNPTYVYRFLNIAVLLFNFIALSIILWPNIEPLRFETKHMKLGLNFIDLLSRTSHTIFYSISNPISKLTKHTM